MFEPQNNLILVDGQDKTMSIDFFNYNTKTKVYSVRYHGNPTFYHYEWHRVKWIKQAKIFEGEKHKVIYKGKLLQNIEYISFFLVNGKKYFHVKFNDGKILPMCGLETVKQCLKDKHSREVFTYLMEIASCNHLGLSKITNDEDQEAEDNLENNNILLNYYNDIKEKGIESILSASIYLNPNKYKNHQYESRQLIFPFGSNNSQMKAVKNAFSNQLSVIQGPPGTGKTQTILNIISNILIAGQNVLVVSNNNSAVENVLEKLAKQDLGFLVATLGKRANQMMFFQEEYQKKEKAYPPKIKDWINSGLSKERLDAAILSISKRLHSIYDMQERLARDEQLLQQVELEYEHYKKELKLDIELNHPSRQINSEELTRLWVFCQEYTSIDHISSANQWIKKIKYFFLKWKMILGYHWDRKFFDKDIHTVIQHIQVLIYEHQIQELKNEILYLHQQLKLNNAKSLQENLQKKSMIRLKLHLYNKYGNRSKPIFHFKDLKNQYNDLINEYPVILSTTFSARNSISAPFIFDYVIMDEASQVSPECGFLALSVAQNAIIVGDSKQLPNVVTQEDKESYQKIWSAYHLPDSYNCCNTSFLDSIISTIPDVPQTILREHYRCHPKIINFCNQEFYDGKLIIMTKDRGEKDVLMAERIRTGRHFSKFGNEHEAKSIVNELLPYCKADSEELGIIAPYNDQVNLIQNLAPEGIAVATVHKFQGREKETIIYSATDDQLNSEFSDNPNIVNVAVSRAKKQFFLAVSGEEITDGYVKDLLNYIEYQNFTIQESKIHSIFDLLYGRYSQERKKFLSEHPHISEYDSENLTFALLEDIIKKEKYSHLGILCHYPLYMLIGDISSLPQKEHDFVMHDTTHLDFLIYDKISHQTVLVVETDGYTYHHEGTKQKERDDIKDHILASYNIPILRLSTRESGERERIVSKLSKVYA
jgi:superfamily I DNA and/or RNA helicase